MKENQGILDELDWRGLVHQTTDRDALTEHLGQSRAVYAGFDPTAPSLHCGSLLPLLMLKRFQDAGHKPIALVGGATGMIGDPSGKSEERNLLSEDALRSNVAGIETQMRKYLDFDGPNAAVLVNNLDWMQDWSYIAFLRDVGKNFPVNVMLAKDSVKNRLGRDGEGGTGLSYTEFSYMLLQAFDFAHLSQNYDCSVQLGGSDQWGNVTAGIDLTRRMHGKHLHALTCPLLLTSDGRKMGKTEAGTIWLDADLTSPYTFYQYWVNVGDEDVLKCLRFLTMIDREEFSELEKSVATDPGQRAAQKRLAGLMTEFIHGTAGLSMAERATQIFFGAEIEKQSDSDLSAIFADVPSGEIERSAIEQGISLIDALVLCNLAKSKSDARRAISDGGVYVNNRRESSVDRQLTTQDLVSETMLVLRKGKKKYALLRIK